MQRYCMLLQACVAAATLFWAFASVECREVNTIASEIEQIRTERETVLRDFERVRDEYQREYGHCVGRISNLQKRIQSTRDRDVKRGFASDLISQRRECHELKTTFETTQTDFARAFMQVSDDITRKMNNIKVLLSKELDEMIASIRDDPVTYIVSEAL